MNIQNLKKSKKGFTLVEIIVVLVIIAILAAIAIPAMTGWIDKANERAILAEARTVLLAAQTLVAEEYGAGTEPADVGFTADEIDAVEELAEVVADTVTSVTRATDFKTVAEIVYQSGNFKATYSSDPGDDTWTVGDAD